MENVDFLLLTFLFSLNLVLAVLIALQLRVIKKVLEWMQTF